MKQIRTRFAPSPTGFLHVGGVRTALFAWLVARQKDGQFILRLEDTDKSREVEGSEQHIMESLQVLGLDYDEGPDKGGPFAPYRQSERLGDYKKWAQKLVDAGRAYADPYSKEEVEIFRDQAQKDKKPFLYRNHRPKSPSSWDGSKPLRFKSEPRAYSWHDEVFGDLKTGPEVIDDFILIKSDGYPTYNFAHIIDDAEMEISHIIRGQEFLASVPIYLNLYEALGLTPPIMATMPHILGPDGKKKLSKRDGAKDILDYIRQGYLAEALMNFIATLGWNDGSQQEIFTAQELIEKFDLKRVQKGGAKFDSKRLNWINGHHIRHLPVEELYRKAQNFWPADAKSKSEEYKKKILVLVSERLKYLAELPQLTGFFFLDVDEADVMNLFTKPVDKQLKNLGAKDFIKLLKATEQELSASDFSTKDLKERLNSLLDKLSSKPGILFATIRIAVTGSKASPEISSTLNVLGREESLSRIQKAISALENKP